LTYSPVKEGAKVISLMRHGVLLNFAQQLSILSSLDNQNKRISGLSSVAESMACAL